ncbi:MAG: hypothetical protein LBQ48_08265 [Oscillospiraceae bacterium]|jgi:hypothetical protein|nr:hypothetical protein [Oscillospiraceae bacterium]
MEPKFLTYKARPLVRNGSTIYYGSMSDKFAVKLEINSFKEIGGMQIADEVLVELIHTDSDIKERERVVKKSRKIGLYNALDISSVWLERALAGN